MSLTMAATSQTVLYQDDFESYSSGAYLAQDNPEWWATWTNVPGTGEDIVITDNQADSGTQSAFITWEDGITDALLKLGDKTSGSYELNWKMYIESGFGAYYNLQHFEEPGVEFAFEIYFYPDGTGEFRVGNDSYFFSYDHDTWFSVSHIFNLDEDQATLSINDVEIHTWPFHYSTWSKEGTNQLGAVDFNDGEGFRYYIDDVEYDSLNLTGIWTNDLNHRESNISVYPNPATDQISVTSDEEITDLEILDQFGRKIYKQDVGNNFLNLDISGYRSGVYLLRIKSTNGLSASKLIVH